MQNIIFILWRIHERWNKKKSETLRRWNSSESKKRVSRPRIQPKHSSLTLTVSWFYSKFWEGNYYRDWEQTPPSAYNHHMKSKTMLISDEMNWSSKLEKYKNFSTESVGLILNCQIILINFESTSYSLQKQYCI